MNLNPKFASSDLALAIRYNTFIDCSDDIDPELLYPGVEEEEEEEEEDEGLEEEEEEDRGDEVDPDLEPDVDDDNEEPLEEQEEEQEELDPDALAELAGDSKSKMVPHARFNEVNESLKTERATRLRLEEELARAKGKAPADKDGGEGEEEVKPFDFDAAEERYMDAIMEGEKDKAKQIRAEIRSQEKAYYTAEATKGAKETVEQERARSNAEAQQAAMVGVLEKAVTKYPFLNHESEEANTDAIDEVVALRNHYFSKGGVTLAQALDKAVAKVGPRYAEVDDGEEEEKPKPGRKGASKEQIERNIERDKKQPSRMPGIGERNSKIDFANLSEEDFANLTAADKKKARGDYVG